MKFREIRKQLAVCLFFTAVCSVICLFFSKICALFCLICGLAVSAVYAYSTYKRYKKLNELNDYLSLVCAGNYNLDINSNTEGELSILQNNLYKVIVLLRSQNDMLKKDKLYLVDALADISHQLKTPLTSVMIITDLIKEEDSADKRKDFVKIIESQCEKMKWLIQTLLKLSKLDAGTIEMKSEQVSAENVIDEALKPFLYTIDIKSITLEKDIENFIFTGDKNWSVEAVQNIIKNSIEHTPEKGSLYIRTKSNLLYDSLLIKDSGEGIEKEELPHIFDRFYQGSNASKDSVGIGLALSKSLLAKQNAVIEASSEKGEGTEFIIKFYKGVV
ncbi:MAG: sensor histidine kinase [Eubacterium sp.]